MKKRGGGVGWGNEVLREGGCCPVRGEIGQSLTKEFYVYAEKSLKK